MGMLRMGGRQTHFWGPWDEDVMMQPWRLKGESKRVSQTNSSTALPLLPGHSVAPGTRLTVCRGH